jgi:CRISPR-associated endonuclease/helicase Cas3
VDYSDFFQRATGNRPFGFQERLRAALGRSTILKAPTGLGKTDSVLVAWLHRRAVEPTGTPRRLVWCLPGRALTEQVASVAETRIQALVEAGLSKHIRVYRLLGGSGDNDLKIRPDEDAVLVGTQDILVSRALNRGYARNPLHWPIDFALLNSDCYWVMDEVQLLGDALATSLQLAAFREKFGFFGAAPTCWISATIDPAWMETVDFPGNRVPLIEPDEDDRANPVVLSRLRAEKRLERAPASCRLPQGVAEFAAREHAAGTLTLVITNTVKRAVEIRTALEKRTKADVRLLHSRFRAADRREHVEAALSKGWPPEGRIVVATQVIEAGIDIDASLMVTDVAPYPSVVQRFGRVNRRGERKGCRIYWVDRPLLNKQKALTEASDLSAQQLEGVCAPYEAADIRKAIGMLEGMSSAAPDDLPPLSESRMPWKHVLRLADLLDLFDTSSDLGGNVIDISRFVRSGEDHDVYVLWREWDRKNGSPGEESNDSELCPVPIGEAPQDALTWNAADGLWARPEKKIYPGMTLLLHTSEGKYTKEYGWSLDSKAPVPPVSEAATAVDRIDADPRSFLRREQTLEAHTQMVLEDMRGLIRSLDELGLDAYRADLEEAARYHDWGKAHPVMQKTLQGKEPPYSELLAKSKSWRKHDRRFFAHELASGLAMIQGGCRDLPAYVAVAHHGRIRVMVRSMPGERAESREYIRGLKEGDRLLPCSLGDGVQRGETAISLRMAELGFGTDGEASWTERVLRLRDELGPFRLAYLEMLLRAADAAASARAEQEVAL